MIKEVKTSTSTYHNYQIPFEEFWATVKNSPVVGKLLYFSPSFPSENTLSVHLEKNHLEEFIKRLKLKGKLRSVSAVNEDIVEISTMEESEEKHDWLYNKWRR